MHFRISSKYYFSKLNDAEKKVYWEILCGWFEYKNQIILKWISAKVDYQVVFDSMKNDIPELFYVDFSNISVVYTFSSVTITVKFLYSKAKSEENKKRIHEKLMAFCSNCRNSIDIEREIHEYLVNTVKYSADLCDMDAYSVCGPFLNKNAVCEGYAHAFKLLCDYVNIPCIVVSGKARNEKGLIENHAWNIVRKNGINYHVDVTWDCTICRQSNIPMYFNVSDEFIRKDHSWNAVIYPKCKTAGNVEKEIIDVLGEKSFEKALLGTILGRKEACVVRFNIEFSSSEDILSRINSIFNRQSITTVNSYSVMYIRNLDCAVIKFSY